jgi:predicted transcriptional regulator
MTRRNKLEILGSILDICKADGSSKTRIVYQVNLNFKNAGSYLDWLIKRGYIVKEDRVYKTTHKGEELSDNLNYINSVINDDTDKELTKSEE